MAKQWHQLEKLDHKALKKLQVEREKAQQVAIDNEEKKRRMIIGVVVMAALLVLGVFVVIMRKRAAALAFQDERGKLLFSRITEITGKVEHRHIGAWELLREKFEFDKEYSFKTAEEGAVTVQLQLENQIKLSGKSEMTVMPPALADKDNKIEREPVILKRGELTSAISLDGRGILIIDSSDIQVTGSSGLFKVIYDEEKDKGEVVVKNGLVEVSKKRGGGKPVKVSGFYKITFGGGEVSAPTQASVIQYDWR